MKYKPYSLYNFRKIPQIENLTEEQKFNIEVVGTVLPFKTNNYVIDELIDWDNFEEDPLFILNFPQKEMIDNDSFNKIAALLKNKASKQIVQQEVNKIRLKLNPNPAGQESNVPVFEGKKLNGIQHKYKEIMLFFPTQGQTCHAYCTFCFRWPQFALSEFKFAMKEADSMVSYLCWNQENSPTCTNRLITLDKMEEQLEDSIGKGLETCINVYDYSNDVEVNEDWELDITINYFNVDFNLDYPVSVVKGEDDSASEDEFGYEADVALGEIYEVTQDIVNQHASLGEFDQLLYMLSKLSRYTIYKNRPYPDVIYQVKLREKAYVFQFGIQGEENV